MDAAGELCREQNNPLLDRHQPRRGCSVLEGFSLTKTAAVIPNVSLRGLFYIPAAHFGCDLKDREAAGSCHHCASKPTITSKYWMSSSSVNYLVTFEAASFWDRPDAFGLGLQLGRVNNDPGEEQSLFYR